MKIYSVQIRLFQKKWKLGPGKYTFLNPFQPPPRIFRFAALSLEIPSKAFSHGYYAELWYIIWKFQRHELFLNTPENSNSFLIHSWNTCSLSNTPANSMSSTPFLVFPGIASQCKLHLSFMKLSHPSHTGPWHGLIIRPPFRTTST